MEKWYNHRVITIGIAMSIFLAGAYVGAHITERLYIETINLQNVIIDMQEKFIRGLSKE